MSENPSDDLPKSGKESMLNYLLIVTRGSIYRREIKNVSMKYMTSWMRVKLIWREK